MTKKQAIIRLLLAVAASSLLILGRSRATGWIAVLILVCAWIWTEWVLKHQPR
jgi:hypothetical protein